MRSPLSISLDLGNNEHAQRTHQILPGDKLVTMLLLAVLVGWGIVTAPFGWQVGVLPSTP